jgi:mono/diheme cytochrome c family protein
MKRKHVLLAAAIALAVPTGHGEAQQVGQPGRGLASAEQLCAQCHAVQKGLTPSRNENAPSFQAIATVPGMTEIALSAALNTSHATMPNIVLEPDERADIIAYILSLKCRRRRQTGAIRAMKAMRQPWSLIPRPRPPPSMPLTPATRPVNSINNAAERPISPPPRDLYFQ